MRVLDHLHWDILRLYGEIKTGLARYHQEYGSDLKGIGLDTWGVDFGLLDAQGELLSNPRHYRDPRTNEMIDAACEIMPREEIFAETGIQFMQLNSLFQLLAMRVQGDPKLDQARTLLMIPDLLNYWLTGVKANEFSAATTTQCYNPRTRSWSQAVLERLDIPTRIFGEIVPTGTTLGPLYPAVAEETGVKGVSVIAPACHDTGSAVVAVPAQNEDFCYISSGTWSLMGIESPEPIINADSLAFNFTNEGGVNGTIRFLKNIMGLWLVQESRRTWQRQGENLSYDQITRMAAEARPFGPLVEPDSHAFLAPGDMVTRIRKECQRLGQQPPETRGEIIRCALESLALKYRWALEKIEIVRGRPLKTIHVVGGGCQNALLCQLTADATGRTVVAGPIEATATGNILMQAVARGQLASVEEARQVVRNSFKLVTYEPKPSSDWDKAYARFLRIRQQTPGT